MNSETIEKLKKEIHTNAVRQGWWEDGAENLVQKRALVICELAEAIEADRKGKFAKREAFTQRIKELIDSINVMSFHVELEDALLYRPNAIFCRQFENYIKDSVEDELADAAIRVMDLMAHSNVPAQTYTAESSIDLGGLLFDVAYHLEGYLPYALYLVIKHCEYNNIDLLWHIEKKMEYNLSRPYKHGKAY